MKLNRVKAVTFFSLLFLTDLFSEKLGHNFQIHSEPSDQSAWIISHNFENGSNYSQAIIIPFNYPFEANFLPKNTPPPKFDSSLQNSQYLFLQNFYSSSTYTLTIKPTKNTEILTYKTNTIQDNSHYARDTNSRIHGIWQMNPMINTTSGIVFMYLKKNMGLNLDLSFRMAGNDAGHALFESLVSNINFSYKLSDQIFNMNPNYRLNMVLRLSSIQYLDDRISPKKLEFNKATLRSQFISSGFTFNTKNVMFEGFIRLPVQQQAVFDLDGLLRPELQGRLGMKWYLPEFIQP